MGRVFFKKTFGLQTVEGGTVRKTKRGLEL